MNSYDQCDKIYPIKYLHDFFVCGYIMDSYNPYDTVYYIKNIYMALVCFVWYGYIMDIIIHVIGFHTFFSVASHALI